MNLQMVQLFTSKLKIIDENKAFWIEGAGGKSFCAGGDVKVLFEKGCLVE
jgi:enoyl-CoA hydratase/carnithine racemase